MSDLLKKYLFPDQSTRVHAVKLAHAWQTGLAHQQFPEAVQSLLGELVAASVLLASNLKLDGSLILQLQGDGPVALIVVECTSQLQIRATATIRDDTPLPQNAGLQQLLNAHGQGRFSVVLDPAHKAPGVQPYQGIVPLEGDSVAAVLQAYMRNSEQLETHLWLGANPGEVAGLLIQRLPGQGLPAHDGATGSSPEETFERATALAATLDTPELLALDTDTLIHRLFWQESLLAFEPSPVSWSCPCTRQRVSNMLRMLGPDEINSVLAEQGKIDVSCNFCGKPYHFDAVDCAKLLHDSATSPGSSSVH